MANQREHVVLLLSNEQSRLGIPEQTEPVSRWSSILLVHAIQAGYYAVLRIYTHIFFG